MTENTELGIDDSGKQSSPDMHEKKMPSRDVFEHALSRILWELQPYLADIVIVGGWVPYLYQTYGNFSSWRGRLSLTTEVDVLLTRELPLHDRPPLENILKSADFSPTSGTDAAAVWANDPDRGEKIEFLLPHAGLFRDLGRVIPIGAQHGLGAISLVSLDILQRHTTTLSIPATAVDGTHKQISIRVPRLGAYIINKADTFLRRNSVSGDTSNPKRAKDLLYLRDLAAGGNDVIGAIEHDIADMLAADPSAQYMVDAAANNLDGVVRPESVVRLDEVGAMLAEREPGMSRNAATADVTGYLTDLAQILIRFRSPAPLLGVE